MVKQDPFTFQARGKGARRRVCNQLTDVVLQLKARPSLPAARAGYIMEAGPLYMHVRRRSHVAGVNLGVDLSLRDLKQPLLLLRALFAGAARASRDAKRRTTHALVCMLGATCQRRPLASVRVTCLQSQLRAGAQSSWARSCSCSSSSPTSCIAKRETAAAHAAARPRRR